MRLAVVRLSALGDLFHTFPLLHVLKRNLKAHEILLVTQPGFAGWAGSAPFVDRVLPADLSSHTALGASLAAIREERLDCILDAQGLYKSALLAFRSGAALRVGFSASACREPLSALFHQRRVKPTHTHVIDRNLALAGAVGCADLSLEGYALDFLPQDPDGHVQAFLDQLEGRPFILFHPFSSRAAKDFPVESVRPLIPVLQARGLKLVVSCGPGQIHVGGAAAQSLSGTASPLFSICEMAVLIARAACVMAPDTGFFHLADGLRKPTISYYTHLPPERNGPYFMQGLTFWRTAPDPAKMAAFVEAL